MTYTKIIYKGKLASILSSASKNEEMLSFLELTGYQSAINRELRLSIDLYRIYFVRIFLPSRTLFLPTRT